MDPISIHLPIELILHIFVQSEQQDLLRLRGIARVFNRVLTRLAFRTIQTRCIAAGSVKRFRTFGDEHPLLGVHVEALRVIYDRESKPGRDPPFSQSRHKLTICRLSVLCPGHVAVVLGLPSAAHV
jgi:hypothetical protein